MYDPTIRIYYCHEAMVFTSADRVSAVLTYIRERQPGMFQEYRATLVERAAEACCEHKAWGVCSLFVVNTQGTYGETSQIETKVHPLV